MGNSDNLTSMKTKLSVRVKAPNGVGVLVLPEGSTITRIFRSEKSGNYLCEIPHESRPAQPYRVRVTSAFRAPTVATMERWSNDGVARSVLGKLVEPDGHDEHGSPSWLLALGLI